MRLGLNIGYWSGGSPADDLALTRVAEDAGYSVVWVAEAYGSDAVSILGWLAGQTTRIDVGSAVMQIPGRTPALTAMTAATLDTLSGGRFRLGLGVSGPQVSEGWHGVPFAAPLARTREYVDVVRLALARQDVRYDGTHIKLPLPGGPGKALRLTIRPPRPDLPIYLAAVGPKNLELAGEIADGWLAIFFSPEQSADQMAHLRTGSAKRSAESAESADSVTSGLEGFDIVPTVPVCVEDDLDAAADRLRPYTALYVGGMGSKEQNFYFRMACQLGFEEAAHTIQDHYLARRHRDAAAAVPFELIDATALVGPPARIQDRLSRYAEAGVTTLSLTPYADTRERREEVVRIMADLL